MNAYIFCIRTKLKTLSDVYLYVDDFVYPYIVIKASNLTEALNLIKEYTPEELIYIDNFKIHSKNNSNIYNKYIIKYIINVTCINLSLLDKIIQESWEVIENNPKLLKYNKELSRGENVDMELIEHGKMQATMSMLFYGLEDVESSMNDINYKLSRLNTLIKDSNYNISFSDRLKKLRVEHERLRNEFNKVDNKVSTLLRIKNWQIETLTSMLTQRKMTEIRDVNNHQYRILIESAEDSAKGDVLEIALIWLAIMQVYGIFSDKIDSFFTLKGFDLILTKIFVSIIFFVLTLFLVKIGHIFVKIKHVKFKDEKRLL